VEHANAWIRQLAGRLAGAGAPSAIEATFREADLSSLLALREALRGVAGALVGGVAPDVQDVDRVNRAAALAPRWTSIAWDDGPAKATETSGTPVDQVFSVLADDAIGLFTGTNANRLRLCERPGCVLFFLKDHPRREWCTPACGARVRAARSYEKRVQRQRAAASS
jgi:predicted RNA-binding Zn ribbon-like protein